MKFYCKTLITIFICLITTSLFAQKESEEVEETVIESTETAYEVEVTESDNRVISQGLYNFSQKYKLNNINDKFDWFYDKNASYNNKRYGIVNKKGEVILPNIFKYSYASGSKDDQIIYIDNN